VLQFALGAGAAPLVGLFGSDSALPMAVFMLVLMACSILTFTVLGRQRKS
jgi:DHA1 family bicyclomycin/chloramphenicol resistance-like MFS transporter